MRHIFIGTLIRIPRYFPPVCMKIKDLVAFKALCRLVSLIPKNAHRSFHALSSLSTRKPRGWRRIFRGILAATINGSAPPCVPCGRTRWIRFVDGGAREMTLVEDATCSSHRLVSFLTSCSLHFASSISPLSHRKRKASLP